MPKKTLNKKPQKRGILPVGTYLADTFSFTKVHYKKFAKIAATAASINLVIGFLSPVEEAALFQAFLFFLTSCAVLWTITQARSGKDFSLKAAYFSGTAGFLSFFVTAMFQLVALMPFWLAVIGYALVYSYNEGNIANWLHVIFITVNILALTGSLLLIARLIFAPIIAATTGYLPAAAIAQSWRLSRGKLKSIILRLLILGIIIFAIVFVASLALRFITLGSFASILVEEVTIQFLIIPFTYVFLYFLYAQLNSK